MATLTLHSRCTGRCRALVMLIEGSLPACPCYGRCLICQRADVAELAKTNVDIDVDRTRIAVTLSYRGYRTIVLLLVECSFQAGGVVLWCPLPCCKRGAIKLLRPQFPKRN